jgi:hypothetical protein
MPGIKGGVLQDPNSLANAGINTTNRPAPAFPNPAEIPFT